MENLFSYGYVIAFLVGVVLHSSGWFYDTEAVEEGTSVKPVFIIAAPVVVLFIVNVIWWMYFR